MDEERYPNSPVDVDTASTDKSSTEEKLARVAEEKLVSFCEQVLREASDLQSSVGETTNMDIHCVLELRSPIIVKVYKLLFLKIVKVGHVVRYWIFHDDLFNANTFAADYYWKHFAYRIVHILAYKDFVQLHA